MTPECQHPLTAHMITHQGNQTWMHCGICHAELPLPKSETLRCPGEGSKCHHCGEKLVLDTWIENGKRIKGYACPECDKDMRVTPIIHGVTGFVDTEETLGMLPPCAHKNLGESHVGLGHNRNPLYRTCIDCGEDVLNG